MGRSKLEMHGEGEKIEGEKIEGEKKKKKKGSKTMTLQRKVTWFLASFRPYLPPQVLQSSPLHLFQPYGMWNFLIIDLLTDFSLFVYARLKWSCVVINTVHLHNNFSTHTHIH